MSDSFLNKLTKSGILSSDALRTLPPQTAAESPNQAAERLVADQVLTSFQAQALLEGNAENLILEDYILLDKLGEGGMGVVYKARHRRMDRLVALKVLPPAAMQSPEAVKRFHREVQAAAKLIHPNIVAAYDAREANGVHFLVMELVEGRNLAQIVRCDGPLPVRVALDCIVQAARGLAHAHEKGIIHRDIKPSNLILRVASGSRVCKILDMGLARFEAALAANLPGDEMTRTGVIMGTVDFMAPEQALDPKLADARSDIYSLGCTFYYLLTGQLIYAGDTPIMKLVAHREEPIPDLRAKRTDISAEIEALFRKMVAKKPGERYQSMGEIALEVESCLRGAPAEALGRVVPVEEDATDRTERLSSSRARRDAEESLSGTERELLSPRTPEKWKTAVRLTAFVLGLAIAGNALVVALSTHGGPREVFWGTAFLVAGVWIGWPALRAMAVAVGITRAQIAVCVIGIVACGWPCAIIQRDFLGVEVGPTPVVPGDPPMVGRITSIKEGSAGLRAGLRDGDRIVSISAATYGDKKDSDLKQSWEKTLPRGSIQVRVLRGPVTTPVNVVREPDLVFRVYWVWQFLCGAAFVGFFALIIATQPLERFAPWRGLGIALASVGLIILAVVVTWGFGEWKLISGRVPFWSDVELNEFSWQKLTVSLVSLTLILFGVLELRQVLIARSKGLITN
ncbi:MAG: protein kinase [Planctomycetes bacterium]|nr:protein kinase [Planctomycetota bacterium]